MRLLARRLPVPFLAVPCLAALCLAAAPPAAATATTATAATAAVAGEPQVASLLDIIELWLAANFDLPPAVESPAVVSVPAAELVEMRYGSRAAVRPGRVVAVYDEADRTIYVTEGWTARTPADLSVLVHEMVHHLQAAAGMRFACPAEREALAYRAQDTWLGLFGTNIESTFGIDAATLLASTICTH